MSRATRIAVAAILVANVALTVWLCASLPVKVDEAYTLHTTSAGFAYAVREALVFELQPPLYFATVELWRQLGSSIFLLRVLSIIATALMVYVAGLVAKRYLSEYHRVWVMAAVAFNPFVILRTVDARVYPFVMLWSSLLMLLFYDGYLAADRAPRARLAFAIVAVLALYTQYYTGFLLPAFGLVLVLRRQWRDVGAFALWMGAVAMVFAPIALFVRGEMGTQAINFVADEGFVGGLIEVTKLLVQIVLPIAWGGQVFHAIAYAVAFTAIAFVVWRSDKTALATVARVPATITLTAVIGFIAVVTAAHMTISSRYVAAFVVPTFVVLFALVSAARGLRARRVIALAGLAVTTVCVISLAVELAPMAKPGDAARVAAFITAHESPHQPIVVFDAQNALPLAYHYKGVNAIVPMPRPMRFDRYDLRDIAIHDTSEVESALDYRPGNHGQLWFVTPSDNNCRRTPINLHCELLYDFVAQHYDTLTDKQFFEARVRLLRERR